MILILINTWNLIVLVFLGFFFFKDVNNIISQYDDCTMFWWMLNYNLKIFLECKNQTWINLYVHMHTTCIFLCINIFKLLCILNHQWSLYWKNNACMSCTIIKPWLSHIETLVYFNEFYEFVYIASGCMVYPCSYKK